MKTSGKGEAELTKAARPKKLPRAGWYDNGNIDDVEEAISQANNEMFKCTVSFTDEASEKWSLITYLLDTPKTGLLLRRACAARGVLAKFESGSVDPADLPGPVRLKIGIEKGRRGWPDRLRVEDFASPASSPVVELRSAMRTVALIGGVMLGASALGGCSTAPWPGMAQMYDVQPSTPIHYPYYADPPPTVADAAPVSQPTPTPKPSWQHDLSKMGEGAGIGVVGSMAANRWMSSGARTGAADLAGGGAADLGAGAVTTGEAVGGAAGAVTGGEALGETLGGDAIIDGLLDFLAEDGFLLLLGINYDEPQPCTVAETISL